jgi:hypothetical protein
MEKQSVSRQLDGLENVGAKVDIDIATCTPDKIQDPVRRRKRRRRRRGYIFLC